MPLYEYQCNACAHRFERIQKFSDSPIDTCPVCGGVVRKLVSSPAIQFKGSGFYITDYASKERVASAASDSAAGSDKAGSDKAGGDKAGGDKAAVDRAGGDKPRGEKKESSAPSSDTGSPSSSATSSSDSKTKSSS